MTLEPRVQRIMAWRENFVTLPDPQFFDLIRMYLGEIHTPYNKQKLVEELSAFLRKDENKAGLVRLLTDEDLKLVAAVFFIPHATPEKLATFFSTTRTFAAVYGHLVNLEERLILYRHPSKDGQTIISINPMLEDALEPLLSLDVLLPGTVLIERYDTIPASISAQLVAAFISFALSHPDLCKADGQLKKRALADVQEVFGTAPATGGDGGAPGGMPDVVVDRMQRLATALCAMNLFHDSKKGLAPDWQRLNLFASLPDASQFSYICVASTGGAVARHTLQQYAQLLLDVLRQIPPSGFSRETILQLAVLLKERAGGSEAFQIGRFERMLSRRSSSAKEAPDWESGRLELVVDAAIAFGMLYPVGKNESEALVYVPVQMDGRRLARKEVPKVLSIDAGFSITVMPGLNLEQLLPLTKFLNIVRYDVAAVYEINRHSVMRAFDTKMLPDDITEELQRYSAFEVPQNLGVSIEEWYQSYSSATLYKGYVLKVTAENIMLAQRNPRLAPYIREVLAPGIFLLNFANDEEAKYVMMRSGLDAVGTIKTAEIERPPLGLVTLLSSDSRSSLPGRAADAPGAGAKKFERAGADEQAAFLDGLREQLAGMEMTADQREGLAGRINRRVIVNPVQLRGGSVRIDMLEAGGIDYQGKLHVIEGAIQNKGMVEIQMEDGAEPLIGMPLAVSKKAGNVEFTVRLENGHSERSIPIGAAVRIKKIRGVMGY